jgi:predicted NBD/HSP70 family sugar kinase
MKSGFTIVNSLDKRSSKLLALIQKYGPLTKIKLEYMTKLKKSTLNRGLEILQDSLLIANTETEESTGGRKASLFDVNGKLFYLIGVDISRTYIQLVLTNLKMVVLKEKTIYGELSDSFQGEILIKLIKDLLVSADVEASNVIGIGLGVVLPIHKTDYINDANNIKALLQDELGLPVFFDNGANTALLAEYNFGIGRDKGSIAYVHCGVGIRTAVISKDSIIRTINNSEDAFGHMIVEVSGDLCSCGNYGCVESYASISKITSRFIAEVKKGKRTKLSKTLEEVSYIDVCELAENEDELAKSIIEDAAVYFGIGLANFIKILAPEMVILSGPLIKNSPFFYEKSKEVALKKCSPSNAEFIQFCRGGFFEDKSIATGAAFLAFDELLKNNLRK